MYEPDHLSHRERLVTSLALAAYFIVAYSSVELAPSLTRVGAPMMRLDRMIAFDPGWIWVYVSALPAAALPAFVVSSRATFRSASLAYVLATTVSVACFIAFPQTAITLRPPTGLLDLSIASEWLVANVYAIDPPRNLFPSLHLSITTLSALATWKANRILGLSAFVGVALIAVSACAVKQHFIADVIGGIVLAVLVAAPTVARSSREKATSQIWTGAIIYLLFLLCFYAAIAGAFLGGLVLRRCQDGTGTCIYEATLTHGRR